MSTKLFGTPHIIELEPHHVAVCHAIQDTPEQILLWLNALPYITCSYTDLTCQFYRICFRSMHQQRHSYFYNAATPKSIIGKNLIDIHHTIN